MGVPPPGRFKASKAWAQAFFKRHGFQHKKAQGEQLSSDSLAARDFPAIVRELIEDGGYTLDQVFNVDETALYWKKMPTTSYISKEAKHARGMKPFKNRITLLLGCNASGTHKLKPLILHTSQNPRAYKNINVDKRGVYWRSNKKAWMTMTIMCDWFDNMFVPEVRAFCRRQNKDFKCLLLLDNAPGHSRLLVDRHPNVKVEFLPARTTSLIQPMDQELISQVKAHYYKRTFRLLERANDASASEFVDLANDDEEQAVAGPSTAPLPGVKKILDFWKAFSIKDVTDTMLGAWGNITAASIHHAWRPLLGRQGDGEAASHPFANREEVDRQVAEAVAITQRLPGFDSITTEGVFDMLGGQQPEPSVEEMVEEADEEEREAEEEGGEGAGGAGGGTTDDSWLEGAPGLG